MTPQQKISSIESQISDCAQGRSNVILCPFCHGENRHEHASLCCADMGLTVRAILRKQARQENIDTALRIADHIAGMN